MVIVIASSQATFAGPWLLPVVPADIAPAFIRDRE